MIATDEKPKTKTEASAQEFGKKDMKLAFLDKITMFFTFTRKISPCKTETILAGKMTSLADLQRFMLLLVCLVPNGSRKPKRSNNVVCIR